mmetsp:Transcript_62515/g.116948  ORF Transcript_62515/g.116948 Transcript_62515/m.116948 type:complete len:153 (+) Transcript_62515:40-498(+)
MGSAAVACQYCEQNCKEEIDSCVFQRPQRRRKSDLILGKTCAAMKVLHDTNFVDETAEEIEDGGEDNLPEIFEQLQGSWYDQTDGDLVGSISGVFIVWNKPWTLSDDEAHTRLPNLKGHIMLDVEGHVLIGQICMEPQPSIVWSNGQVWLKK